MRCLVWDIDLICRCHWVLAVPLAKSGNAPELEQQGRQALLDYATKLAMSPQEMELSGISRGYLRIPEQIGCGNRF